MEASDGIMEWDITWEISSEGNITKESGIVRVSGEKTVDALTTFFKNRDNKNRQLVGITAVYEKMEKRRKTL